MSAREPISWLRLEQHHLGELREPIELSDADRSCLDYIEADARPLPALELPERRERARFWLWPSVGLAAASLLAVLIWRGAPEEQPSVRTGTKGGDLAMVLVRERAGAIEEEPTTFAPGDRFKLLVTCAPAERVRWDVVVEQGGERSFPLPAGSLVCGSRVPLPGAFALTGDEPAVVCLVVTSDAWPRAEPAPEETPCVRLRPVR